MKTSILIPITKPKSAKRCITAIKHNAGVAKNEYEIIAEIDKERIGLPKMLKRLLNKAQFENIMFLGDDTYPYPDFLKNALETMKSLPDGWGMVGLNDLVHNGNQLATHFMISKKLLPYLDGEILHTGYKHNFADQELLIRCKRLNRYVWCRNAMLFHNHPAVTGRKAEEGQEDYERIQKYHQQDLELLRKRVLRF